MSLSIAIAQFNPAVGDLAGNARAIERLAEQAHAQGAAVLLTPELALTGYPPEDLLLRPAFMHAVAQTLQELAQRLRRMPGLVLVIGHPHVPGAAADERTPSTQRPLRWNAASVLRDGRIEATYGKLELPNYQVFDERRYFARGGEPVVFEAGGVRLGLNVCEDAWFAEAPRRARDAGAQVLLVLNASPFHLGKSAEREAVMRLRCRENGMALSLSIPLPVFDRQQVGRQRAEAEALQARAEYRLARSRAEGELRGLYLQAERLRATAADYRTHALAATPELLRIAEAAYRGGESTLLELLDAYRGALETETTALELEQRAREARIEYDLITGSPE